MGRLGDTIQKPIEFNAPSSVFYILYRCQAINLIAPNKRNFFYNLGNGLDFC